MLFLDLTKFDMGPGEWAFQSKRLSFQYLATSPLVWCRQRPLPQEKRVLSTSQGAHKTTTGTQWGSWFFSLLALLGRVAVKGVCLPMPAGMLFSFMRTCSEHPHFIHHVRVSRLENCAFRVTEAWAHVVLGVSSLTSTSSLSEASIYLNQWCYH